MEKTVFSLTRAAYEPPHVAIFEFAVEGGFNLTGGASGSFDDNNGTESIGRDNVSDPWYSK